jgi:N-acetylglucosamine kinase-like BadF-type ATPase
VIGTRYGTYDVDDDGILLISWSQGTNSIVESGWWHAHKEGLEAETEVYGTKGYSRIFPREEPSEDYEHCTQPMYTAQMHEFLGAIEAGRQPTPSRRPGRARRGGAGVRVGGRCGMSLVLGVDGGGRKTYAVVTDDDGAVRGAGEAGASNWEIAGTDDAETAIAVAVGAALEEARASADSIAASAFGLAGMDWPSDGPRLTALVEPVTPGVERRIVNDAFIALRSGTSESWGIAVIAGTGTVAVGRDPVGNEFRTIGEGRAFGDFGDEFDVSELAVRAVADQYTGRGPATMLSDMLCERLGEPTVESLLERLARYDPRFRAPELQNLTPMVLAATEGGDLVARNVLEDIGRALGEAAGVVARRLNMSNLPVEVVLAGGLFRTPNRYLLDELEFGVRHTAPRAELRLLGSPPVVGAALMAMELAKMPITVNAAARLRSEVTMRFWGEATA